MNIVLTGPSGAGKGTHVARLISQFNLVHLSTGDLFRENLEQETRLGLLAKSYMSNGELVPDDVVDAMMEEKLGAISADSGILFDGFPRTTAQADFLERLFASSGRELAAVVYLHVPDSEILERLAGRVTCRACSLPFHKTYRPFRECPSNRCSGEHLYSRPDDRTEIIRTRLKNFHRATAPLLTRYHEKGRLIVLDGARETDLVESDLLRAMESIVAGNPSLATEADFRRFALLSHRVPPAPAAVAPRKSLDLVLLGAPGSGKGTQAETLSARFNLEHIATGDLFRKHLKNATPLGLLAKEFMDRGELVPDDVTDAMVQERLARKNAHDGILLDGFPRSLPQAEALVEMLADQGRRLSGVLYIQVSDDEIVKRLAGRLVCRACQTPYHLRFKRPVQSGICDSCSAPLYHRDDDRPDTIRSRLKTFHAQTEPLIQFYRQEGLLLEVNGEDAIKTVVRDSANAIHRVASSLNEQFGDAPA